MIIHNPILTGSFTYNGIDLSSVTSSTSNISSLNAITASILLTTGSLNTASGSAITRLSSIEIVTGSNITRLSSLEAKTGSYATTGSNTFVGTQTISGSILQSGSFTSTGTLTAQTLVVQTITSSVDFVTGSTRFGSLLTNTHVFSGSVSMNPGGLFITSSGNVGIGTAIPNSTLHVSKGGVSFQVTDTNKTANNTFSVYGLSQTSWAIATGNSGSFSGGEKIVINDNGNIGIGLNGPTNLLHVSKDLPGEAIAFINNTSSTGFGLAITAGSGTRYTLSLNDYNSNALARFLANGITLLGTATSNASMNQTGALQVAGGIRATSGLLTSIEVGTIAQNATTTVNIDYSGLYLITNGGNNSALIMFTRAGGSRGAQLISSTNSNNDIVVGITSEPAGGNYLRIWSSAVGVFSIKNVNAYTGPYSIAAISTQ